MKRKPDAEAEAVISQEILENAQKSVQSDQLQRSAKCVVCGSSCSPNSAEDLCWVCRRLKISAWRDSDQQMPAQE